MLSLFKLEGLEHVATPLEVGSAPPASPDFIFAPYFILHIGELLGSGEKGTSTGKTVQDRGWGDPQLPDELGVSLWVLFGWPFLTRGRHRSLRRCLHFWALQGTRALGRHWGKGHCGPPLGSQPADFCTLLWLLQSVLP